ncbi:MAG: DUF2163 domain-containing protein [Rhodobacterales bacterium]|jgi:uncharacterized phage protein (TIGR02218 family)|nr:DUF2163 domain-containing protein [Rhodobacterales bacterium]
MNAALAAHLATGLTTVCQCWAISRKDGVVYGFTDHDRSLQFGGIDFRADSGLSARALVQGTGLAVDNSEAMGVLSDASLSEAEIDAGRFDGAEVRVWLVNWQRVSDRQLRFRGTIGEIRRGAGAFHAELRGLTEALNQPQGRVYQRICSAVLGDSSCKFDLTDVAFSAELAAKDVERAQVFRFGTLSSYAPRWFERGRLRVLSGVAAGLSGVIKHDQTDAAGQRVIELWGPMRVAVGPGDQVRLEAGCDKRAETCRFKFNNMLNFRGFPFVPGEDWLVSIPISQDDNTGGRLSL